LIDGDRENGVGIDVVAECCSERMKLAMGEVCYGQVANTYWLQSGKFSYIL